jgi:glycosyltransferase involved in cell wall biosynthesis
MKVSIVIPAYNEAENLTLLLDAIKKAVGPLDDKWEIIIINDGSTDNSAEVLARLRAENPSVRVLEMVKNAGQTSGFDAGFKAATGDVVVTMDADLQNDPADIPRLLALIGEYDVVAGIRRKRNDTLVRRVSSKVGNWVRNKITRDNIIDTGCSLKAFKRDKLHGLALYTGMHRFLPTLLKMRGCKVAQIEVAHHERKFGASKYGIANRAWRGLVDCMAVRWMGKRFLRYELKPEEKR